MTCAQALAVATAAFVVAQDAWTPAIERASARFEAFAAYSAVLSSDALNRLVTSRSERCRAADIHGI